MKYTATPKDVPSEIDGEFISPEQSWAEMIQKTHELNKELDQLLGDLASLCYRFGANSKTCVNPYAPYSE